MNHKQAAEELRKLMEEKPSKLLYSICKKCQNHHVEMNAGEHGRILISIAAHGQSRAGHEHRGWMQDLVIGMARGNTGHAEYLAEEIVKIDIVRNETLVIETRSIGNLRLQVVQATG